MPEFDVVGVGLNATDTLLMVPHFPAYAGKVQQKRGYGKVVVVIGPNQ